MKVTMLVTMERPNSYDGKKGHVDQRIIALQDAERYNGKQCPDTFDYVLTKEEEAQFPVDSLSLKKVTIGVDKFEVWQNRGRFRGLIGEVDGKPVVAKPTEIPKK